jgi:hypothetical protein
MILCNKFARLLQKMVACYDAMCWVFLDAMIFCNNFTRLSQKMVACYVLGFLGCYDPL